MNYKTAYENLNGIELHANAKGRFIYPKEYKGFLPNQVVSLFIIHYVFPVEREGIPDRIGYVIGKDIYSDKSLWLYFRDTEHVLKFLEFSTIEAQRSFIRKTKGKNNPLVDRLKSY